MVRFNLDPSSSKVSSSNASVLFKLYRREQAATPNGALPPGWIFNTIGDCLQAKNVDDCVPAAQVNLRDIVPTVSVRGQVREREACTECQADLTPNPPPLPPHPPTPRRKCPSLR
jgi:hypothetical protein